LMIEAMAFGSAVLGSERYAEAATRAASFIVESMKAPDGRLFRTCAAGSTPKLNAYLEDYAFLANALVSLYEATFDVRWLDQSRALIATMIDEFSDDNDGGFFLTGRTHERLLCRNKDVHDSSTPSGNSMAVTAMLRLAKLSGDQELWAKAEQTLHLFAGIM